MCKANSTNVVSSLTLILDNVQKSMDKDPLDRLFVSLNREWRVLFGATILFDFLKNR